jgi:hypothetical protein
MERAVAGLAEVRAELEAWRGQRRKGDRIPEEVWRRAARAVRQYGLNAVSRALRLDYYQLKRRADRCEGERTRSPVFVELSAGTAGEGQRTEVGAGCVVELEKGNGTRLRICVREAATVDWGKVKEAFLGA